MPADNGGSPRAGQVAIVTDSAACLPPALASEHRVIVVPLRLVAVGRSADDDDRQVTDDLLAAAVLGQRLTTARPSPDRFDAAYRQAAADGASAVVSVHLPGRLSGTIDSAELAAAAAPIPVLVVDGQSIGLALGLTVIAAALAAAAGRPAREVAGLAADHGARTRSFCVLDSTAVLSAGGRAARPAQPALITRPLLAISAGQISLVERFRTRAAAQDRLVELAVEAAGHLASPSPGAGTVVEFAVLHVDAVARAARLADRLAAAMPQAVHRYLAEAGAVIRAHAGPGMLAVAVAPHSGGQQP